jgi:hypothetical protein
MAKQVLTNVNVTFGTANTDISAYVASVSLNLSAAEVATTAFGTANAVTRIQGLRDHSVTLSMHQDYPTIEKLFYDVFSNGTAVPLTIKPNGTATAGSTQPSYSMSVISTGYAPINGAVGDLATFDITLPVDGAITKTGTGA